MIPNTKYTIPNTKYQVDGWDGHEDESKQKWTFLGSSNHLNKFVFYHRFSMNLKALNFFLPGSLFYSIVLISTIGYGDQTPKTQWGKVVKNTSTQ